MGGTGDSPVSVGDPPTGMEAAKAMESASRLVANAPALPSGESPDGTGESPVLPAIELRHCLPCNSFDGVWLLSYRTVAFEPGINPVDLLRAHDLCHGLAGPEKPRNKLAHRQEDRTTGWEETAAKR